MGLAVEDLTAEEQAQIDTLELDLAIEIWRRALQDYEPKRERRRRARWKEQHGNG